MSLERLHEGPRFEEGTVESLERDFELVDDDAEAPALSEARAVWNVVVVDDDEAVHEATTFALQGVEILGRPLRLLHADSARSAREVFEHEAGIAVALVDVVMESEDAGLRLVEWIRNAGHQHTRIVLRTGQPGYAPELAVLSLFDINDYRTKAELTRTRLLSALTTAVRAYHQLCTLEEMRRGLELAVRGMADLFGRKTLELFSRGVLTQVAALLDVPASGVVCVEHPDPSSPFDERHMVVISDAGRFEGAHGRQLSQLEDANLHAAFARVKESEHEVSADGAIALLFRAQPGHRLFVYLEAPGVVSEASVSLLKVFSGNIAAGHENVQLMGRLDAFAFRDGALGVWNRNGLERLIERGIAAGKPQSLAFVHIADVETLVGTYGAAMTDEYLRTVVHQVGAALPSGAQVGRSGESVLCVLVPQASVDWFSIHNAFCTPAPVGEARLPVRATMAVVEISGRKGAHAVMRNAQAALLVAERSHRGGVFFYSSEIQRGVNERIRLQSELVRALTSNTGVTMHLQPKVDVEQGEIVGVEALARWNVDGQAVSPAKFVPLVESSGLARVLRDRMVSCAGAWVRARRAAGLHVPTVALNLSMCDIQEGHFAETLLRQLEASGLSHEDVQFEITESGLMEDLDGVVRELKQLRAAGFSIAVDDFGTGYSSLSYLDQLPVNILKIDRCFVERLNVASARKSIASTTLALAGGLGLSVVAEGIETFEQHQALRFLGCTVCQGFLYGRPEASASYGDVYDGWSLERALQVA